MGDRESEVCEGGDCGEAGRGSGHRRRRTRVHICECVPGNIQELLCPGRCTKAPPGQISEVSRQR